MASGNPINIEKLNAELSASATSGASSTGGSFGDFNVVDNSLKATSQPIQFGSFNPAFSGKSKQKSGNYLTYGIIGVVVIVLILFLIKKGK